MNASYRHDYDRTGAFAIRRVAAIAPVAAAFVFVLIGCGRDVEYAYEDEAYAMASFASQFSDGSYIGASVTQTTEFDDLLYLNDRDNRRVLALNRDFELVRAFGRRGQGPGEFEDVTTFYVQQDSLYVFDGSHRRMQVFTLDGRYRRAITMPTVPHGGLPSLMVVEGGSMYFSAGSTTGPIVEVDRSGRIVREFGDSLGDTPSVFQNELRSLRYLQRYGSDAIVSVGWARPIVEVFTLDGELLGRLDLTGHPVFQGRLAYADEEFESGRHVRSVVTSVNAIAVRGSRLYVAAIEGRPGVDLAANRIVVVDLDEMGVERVVRMHKQSGEAMRWISAIGAVGSDGLVVLHATDGSLDQFRGF